MANIPALVDQLFKDAAEAFRNGNLKDAAKLREKAEELARKIR